MPDVQTSKTQLKKSMKALQETGEVLVELSPSRLVQLELPETLHDAVTAARNMSHEAKRRQLQFIGKLMRQVDVAPLREKLAAWSGENQTETARLHRIEHWRNRLINEVESINSFIQSYPFANIQELRTLIRNSRQEVLNNKPPKNSRLLFRFIRDVIMKYETERKEND
ncbi:MAG: DUF615 domain-containing protein [Pseudomonadota bacterium]|nr:DUF615 domain-containing protein [Pseudomonadota bacterium]